MLWKARYEQTGILYIHKSQEISMWNVIQTFRPKIEQMLPFIFATVNRLE